MIKPGEIQQVARKAKVRDTQIEKDYIITWILTGVSRNEFLSRVLVFKGGTVLKKFYFEDYRFSEDLDFTLVDNSVSNEDIFSAFGEVFEYILQEANIPLNIIDDNEHETGNINFYISYVGPLGGIGANKKVKVDISKEETLEYEPVQKSIFEAYSDQAECSLACYSLSEVLVEKMRSLISRTQPRDYYDLWYLTEINAMEVADHRYEFERKAKSKGLNPDDLLAKIEAKLSIFKSRWAGSMGEQIQELPEFEQVSRAVGKHLRKLR